MMKSIQMSFMSLTKLVLMRNNDAIVRLKDNSNIYMILKYQMVLIVKMKTK